MKEKKLNPNWDIVRKALGKEPQTVDIPKSTEPTESHDAPKPAYCSLKCAKTKAFSTEIFGKYVKLLAIGFINIYTKMVQVYPQRRRKR